MKKYLINLKSITLGAFVFISSCVSDDLANVGDLEDFTGPTPFYNLTDVSSSEFDCEEVELWAKYEINFQAGSNLAVNGTQYQWTVTDSDGNAIDGIELINKDLPILELLIDAERATLVAIEEDIADLEFKIPCETDQDKIDVMEAEIVSLQAALQAAEAALLDPDNVEGQLILENIAALEAQKEALVTPTLTDQELIISFPEPGDYTVGLTVTDNLGKSDYTEKIVTINQAIPTIPVPEIAEPSFEDNSLFDGTGDGRDSWRVPSNDAWSPIGGGTTVIQINTDSDPVAEPNLPDGSQAAKFPATGERVAYQEIEVTPGAEYVITYFSAFNLDADGSMKVSILSPNTSSYAESLLEENILATRTDNNVGRVENVFKQHSITFEAGENESVIIYATNTGDEARLDSFAIVVKQ